MYGSLFRHRRAARTRKNANSGHAHRLLLHALYLLTSIIEIEQQTGDTSRSFLLDAHVTARLACRQNSILAAGAGMLVVAATTLFTSVRRPSSVHRGQGPKFSELIRWDTG